MMFFGFAALALLTAYVDYRTDLLVTFTSIYMIILFLAARKVSQKQVYLLAALCLVGTLFSDVWLVWGTQNGTANIMLWRLIINALSFFGTAYMCTSWIRAHRQLRELSEKDFLTQISNRRHFIRELEREISIHCRRRRPFAVAFFDVDDFKLINDSHGHKFGDKVLVRVADSLARHIRPTDQVCRYGGDEFVVFLSEVSPDQARMTIQRIRDSLYRDTRPTYRDISLSIGVVTFALDLIISAEELIAAADREMYRTKKQMRSGISVVRYVDKRPAAATATAPSP